MRTERTARLRAAARSYREAATKFDPCGYIEVAQIINELLDAYELLRDANAIAAGHTWDLDADGMECQHCGYFAPGLCTPSDA